MVFFSSGRGFAKILFAASCKSTSRKIFNELGTKCHARRLSNTMLSASLPVFSKSLSHSSSVQRSFSPTLLSSSIVILCFFAISPRKSPAEKNLYLSFLARSFATVDFPEPGFPVMVIIMQYGEWNSFINETFLNSLQTNKHIHGRTKQNEQRHTTYFHFTRRNPKDNRKKRAAQQHNGCKTCRRNSTHHSWTKRNGQDDCRLNGRHHHYQWWLFRLQLLLLVFLQLLQSFLPQGVLLAFLQEL